MLTFSHTFFPHLLSGRHLQNTRACQHCDLLCPHCEEGNRLWQHMEAVLTLVRDPSSSFFTLPFGTRAGHWATLNRAANAYLHHLRAAVPSYDYPSIPTDLQSQQDCPGCHKPTIWLPFFDYWSGTYLKACGFCEWQQACERAALVWKLERGLTHKNAWIFRQLRQWITEDGCDAFHLEHQLEQWQMGFNPQTESAWKQCSEAQGMLAADMLFPYHAIE